MSDAGDTGTTNTDGAAEATEGVHDNGHLEALTARMDEMGSKLDGIDQIRDAILAQQFTEDDLGDYEADDTNLYYEGDQLDSDEFDQEIDPRVAQEAQQKLQNMIRQEAEGLVAPVKEQLNQMRVRSEANQIAQKYPDLDNPEIAKATIEAAARHAQRLGMPQMADEPAFLELTYLAGRAEEQAQQETPAGGQDGVRLEGAGTAPVDLASAEQEYADRIVNAGGGGLNSLFG